MWYIWQIQPLISQMQMMENNTQNINPINDTHIQIIFLWGNDLNVACDGRHYLCWVPHIPPQETDISA